MSAHYEIVLLIDARPPKDAQAPLPDEHYEAALLSACGEVRELVAMTMHLGLGWLAPSLTDHTVVFRDIWKVDFYEGKLEWLFFTYDGWQEWIEALSARWPHWRIWLSFDTTNRVWAGTSVWDGKEWKHEHYDITDERRLPQWEQVRAVMKRDQFGRLDWGPPSAVGRGGPAADAPLHGLGERYSGDSEKCKCAEEQSQEAQ